MTNQEFSDEFDVLANSYSQQLPFGVSNGLLEFSEYEKSVFLTNAEEEIIQGLYNGTIKLKSFENTEELRRMLDTLVIPYKSSEYKINKDYQLSENSYFFKIPNDVWFIILESADVECDCNNYRVPVIPVTHDEYHRIKKNPFRGTNENRILRIDINI